MGVWGIIAEYYWMFALAILIICYVSCLIKICLIGFKEAFKGILYVLEVPVIGFIIDANNSWIYLSLCVPIILELIVRLYELRIWRTVKGES